MAEEQAAVKNTVTIEQSGPCKKKVIVEIPRETIQKATDEQYETLRKDIVLPGFRKGRAPRRLLEKRFGKETGEQIKLKLLADASDAAIKDSKLDILGEPNIGHEKIEMPADGPMKFDFEVEVRPEFELPALEGIPVEKRKLEVTEAQVDVELEQLRKWSGAWTPREEGKVESGDQVIADATLKVEGAEQPERFENTEIYVRHSGFVGEAAVENLDELLEGGKAGDVKKTTIDVPKTYFKEQYRGKKIELEIAIKDVKYLKPAEITEDFCKRFGVDSEKGLRDALRERLRGRLEGEIRSEMAEQVYKYLGEKTSFELPLDVVADQAMSVLRRQYANLLSRGFQREQIDEKLDQLKAASEKQAASQLKTFFIMDKAAEKLGIKVTDEEINGHIAQLAMQRQQRPQRLREEMAKDGSLAEFGLQVRDEKVLAKLLETAKITEVEAISKPEKPAEKHVRKHTKKEAGEAKEAAEKKEHKKHVTEEKPHRKEHKKAEKNEEKAEAPKKHKTPVRKKKTE